MNSAVTSNKAWDDEAGTKASSANVFPIDG